MSKIEDEAEEFKRKRAAERQRHHRAGRKTYPVQLDKSVIQKLIAKGHILAGADDAEIGAAIAKISVAAINGRMAPALPPETAVELPPRQPKRPKAKGKYRQKKDPGRILTGAEKARVAAQIMAEEERRRFDEEERARVDAEDLSATLKKWWQRRPDGYEWPDDRRERERKEMVASYRARLDALPPPAPKARAFQPFGKSGISKKGGKPVTNGFGNYKPPKSQADTVKPIKTEPKAADVERFAKLAQPDNSVHTTRATDDEIRNYSVADDDSGLRDWLDGDEDY